MKRVFSGARPTGRQHLGNYLGAIQNYVSLQEEYACVYCIVDIHALTTLEDTGELQNNIHEMTLDWLNRMEIEYSHERMESFHIPGAQLYHTYKESVPGDFSSATFFLCAAAVTGAELTLNRLDMNDCQGDKAVVGMLTEMGATVRAKRDAVTIVGGELHGGAFDLNATPDALPAMAVTACFAKGETRLVNVPQARLKETDRLAVMRETLQTMGGEVEELKDGLVIRGRPLKGARVDGHGDHRVVMALAVAGLAAEGRTTISTAESVAVTFPNFVDLMQGCGARMRRAD